LSKTQNSITEKGRSVRSKFFMSQKLVSQCFGYTALHNSHARHPSKVEIIHCSSPCPNIKLRDHTPFTLSQHQHLNAIPTQIFLFVIEQSSLIITGVT